MFVENGFRVSVSIYQYVLFNGDVWKVYEVLDYNMVYGSFGVVDVFSFWSGYKEQSFQTFLELKRQRVVVKLFSYFFLSIYLGSSMVRVGESSNEGKVFLIGGRILSYSSNGISVYYTVISGDFSFLKFKVFIEEMEEKVYGCCRIFQFLCDKERNVLGWGFWNLVQFSSFGWGGIRGQLGGRWVRFFRGISILFFIQLFIVLLFFTVLFFVVLFVIRNKVYRGFLIYFVVRFWEGGLYFQFCYW